MFSALGVKDSGASGCACASFGATNKPSANTRKKSENKIGEMMGRASFITDSFGNVGQIGNLPYVSEIKSTCR
jgi:hypothetical protein